MHTIKWLFFKCLLSIIGKKGNGPQISRQPTDSERLKGEYRWVFCTTIGELNGCKPLIQKIAEQGTLVLITDRDCYQHAFNMHFPDAIIIELQGSNGEAERLLAALPPTSLTVCEIPCTPNDAPCRLSYPFLLAVKRFGTSLQLVNGWLYGYPPSCRQDKVERQLFTREFISLFDVMTVQTAEVKQRLVELGAIEQQIIVAGNIKFDAVKDRSINIKDDISQAIITQLASSTHKIFVAGSLSDANEYLSIITAFKQLRVTYPQSTLIIAPRHPEKQQQLDDIAQLLNSQQFSFEFKSAMTQALKEATDVLVVDTFGELRSFYSIADVSYIGQNHNILEPLTFAKPVIIIDGWEATYPSYPVYQLAIEHKLVTELNNSKLMGDALIRALQEDSAQHQRYIEQKLQQLATALEINCKTLFPQQFKEEGQA